MDKILGHNRDRIKAIYFEYLGIEYESEKENTVCNLSDIGMLTRIVEALVEDVKHQKIHKHIIS